MLNIKAVQNVFIAKPFKKWSHNKTIAALITNKNKPSVKTVIGKVKNTKTGFKKVFNNPKITATFIAVVILSTITPPIK